MLKLPRTRESVVLPALERSFNPLMKLLSRLKNLLDPPKPSEEIAIAHDYLTQKGGAERVVLAMHRAFPQATIYTTLYNPEKTYEEFKNANIVVSPLNKMGIFRKNHRAALPFLPLSLIHI